jgi:hypothetical protein
MSNKSLIQTDSTQLFILSSDTQIKQHTVVSVDLNTFNQQMNNFMGFYNEFCVWTYQ